jgi:hypothetical protein
VARLGGSGSNLQGGGCMYGLPDYSRLVINDTTGCLNLILKKGR